MGIAEILPGISGGTIALITGIYSSLISALASFSVRSISLLRFPRAFFEKHDLGFLIVLFGGMVVGVFSFSMVMNFLLTHYSPIVWAMFSGLILGSVFLIGTVRRIENILKFGVLGLFVGLAFLYIPNTSIEFSFITFFCVSMLAVCAWILPGVSGSFVLLVFGYYQIVLDAISNLRVDILVVLALGMVSGLMVFSKTLRWMLQNYEDELFSLLAGVMLGSLVKLWPWQVITTLGRHEIVGPEVFAAVSGQSSFIGLAFISFSIGIFLVWVSTRIGSTQT